MCALRAHISKILLKIPSIFNTHGKRDEGLLKKIYNDIYPKMSNS